MAETSPIDEDEILATLKGKPAKEADRVSATRIPGQSPDTLVQLIEQNGVSLRGRIERASWWESLLFGWILPIALMVALWSFLARRMNRRGGPLSFGRSRVKIHDKAATERVTFHDVAGVDEAEAELVEVVDFLKVPQKYQALGARIPKGVLLLGVMLGGAPRRKWSSAISRPARRTTWSAPPRPRDRWSAASG